MLLRVGLHATFLGCFLLAVWSAAGSYHVPLNAADQYLLGQELGQTMGPQLRAGTVIDGSVLATLRGGMPGLPPPRSVLLSKFRWELWEGRWLFVASSLFMFAAALAIPWTARGVEAKGQHQADLAECKQLVRDLANRLELLAKVPAEKLSAELDSIAEAVRLCQAAIGPGREAVLRGLGTVAGTQFLEDYAVLERGVNRAWSAVADGYPSEGVVSLKTAKEFAENCLRRMGL